MPKIEEIDQNFKQNTDESGLVYIDCFSAPVRISGLPWREKNQNYHRMDDSLNHLYNFGVRGLSPCTAGVQISFKTNSKKIGIKVDVEWNNLMPHMPYNSSTGVDIYIGSGRNKKFFKTFFVYLNGTDHYEDVREFHDGEMKEITLNLPLYSGVEKMLLGLDAGSRLEMPEPFDYDKPVLFYGSSITQGACASRPGMAYFNILSRKLNFEVVNMGFSSSGKGEPVMAEQIASIPLAAFIYDYDHNAGDAEELEQTHQRFFEIVRAAQPDLPIIMLSKADCEDGIEATEKRKAVIYKTYLDAKKRGDDKVWFIDGQTLYGTEDRDSCTVDSLHPNDFGFMRMAQVILPVLKEALGESGD